MKTLKGLVVIGTAVSIFGCTTNPYTGERQISKTAMAVGIGAVAGQLACKGKEGDDKKKCMTASVGTGVVGGAVVGGYMDIQEKKLREKLQEVSVGVERNKETNAIKLVMPGNITFANNQSDIVPSFVPVLDGVAQIFEEFDKTDIQVTGYTDNVGKDDYNLKLSERRASAVAQYLKTKKVAIERLKMVGLGKANPVATNDTEEGRAQNRRVEIQIIEKKEQVNAQ